MTTFIESIKYDDHKIPSSCNHGILTPPHLDFFDEIAIDPDIKFAAIALRRTYRLKLPDAIIAATALHLEVPLITRNVKDFKNIPVLKLINPFGETP